VVLLDEIKVLDLFGGIGGFRLGLERASDKFTTVQYIDNDKFAVKSYNEIFKEDDDYEPTDAKELETEEVREHDLLCAGFPCQSFSIAGERKGFKDKRGTLFYDIVRILRDKKPEKCLLENVKGLLSAKAVDSEGEPIPGTKGYVFREILETLDDLGYFVEWMCLNSKDFGVPQNRERVFIIGHLGGEPRRKVFPLSREVGGDSGEDGGERDLTDKGYDKDKSRGHHEGNRVFSELRGDEFRNIMRGISPTITRKTGTGGNNMPMVLKNHRNRELREYDDYRRDISPALTEPHHNSLRFQRSEDMRIRKLTPRECWRLQGFPDWAFDRVREVNSDTQLYRQAGNAVTVNVIKAIGKELLDIFPEDRGGVDD